MVISELQKYLVTRVARSKLSYIRNLRDLIVIARNLSSRLRELEGSQYNSNLPARSINAVQSARSQSMFSSQKCNYVADKFDPKYRKRQVRAGIYIDNNTFRRRTLRIYCHSAYVLLLGLPLAPCHKMKMIRKSGYSRDLKVLFQATVESIFLYGS